MDPWVERQVERAMEPKNGTLHQRQDPFAKAPARPDDGSDLNRAAH